MRKMFLLTAVAAMFLSACSIDSTSRSIADSNENEVKTEQVEITSNESDNESKNDLNDLKIDDSKLQQVISIEVRSDSIFGPDLNEVVIDHTDEMNARGYRLTDFHSMSLNNSNTRHLVTMVFDKIEQ